MKIKSDVLKGVEKLIFDFIYKVAKKAIKK